jgi:hypothetical protein
VVQLIKGSRLKKNNKRGFKQNYFKPRHPEKYIGDVNDIVYMSSWEETFMKFLDNNPNVIRWGSECIAIPYVKPTDGKVHRYFPDFYMEYNNRKGQLIKEIVEVKPEKQIKKPTTRGKSKKTQLYEGIAWAINTAKWRSAQLFCDKYGLKFSIKSEKEIFK